MELRDTGGDGPPVLFLHGALVDGSLWDPVVALLGDRRCLIPTLPLGSHTSPVADRSALTPPGVVDLIADLLDDLALPDLTIVGNDTGGGLMQLLVTRRPRGVSKLVFTNCDALEVFPPWMFKPLFALGRAPWLLEAAVAPMRLAPARRLPIAYGWLTKRASSEQLARWVRPALSDREVLRDVAHFIARADPGLLLDAAPSLSAFPGEVVFGWGADDRCFPVTLGRRLAAQFRDARFVEIPDSYAFVPIDRPDALAPLI
jgi:pimeloyl-ACP methyl ester carboxylesterase